MGTPERVRWQAHLVGHLLAVVLGGVDQGLVQVDHEHQLPVPVQALLVFPPQLLGLLQRKRVGGVSALRSKTTPSPREEAELAPCPPWSLLCELRPHPALSGDPNAVVPSWV